MNKERKEAEEVKNDVEVIEERLKQHGKDIHTGTPELCISIMPNLPPGSVLTCICVFSYLNNTCMIWPLSFASGTDFPRYRREGGGVIVGFFQYFLFNFNLLQ